MDTVIVFAVFLFAGLVQGAAGFGFGLIVMGILPALCGLRDAAVLVMFPALGVQIYLFIRLRKHFKIDRMLPLLISALVAVPLGVLLLRSMDPKPMQYALGTVILVAVVQNLIPNVARRRWHPAALGIPCGLFSGLLAGAFATGGPPLAAYTVTQRFDRFRYVSVLQVVFTTMALVRLPALGVGGLLTIRLLALSAAGSLFSIGGAWVGLHVLKRISDKGLRYVVLGMLFVLGVRYFIT
jgi:uncharacterized membrane protein YfcA